MGAMRRDQGERKFWIGTKEDVLGVYILQSDVNACFVCRQAATQTQNSRKDLLGNRDVEIFQIDLLNLMVFHGEKMFIFTP